MKFQESLLDGDFWGKAYSLAFACKAAYRPEDVVAAVTKGWGFSECTCFDKGDTQGFVASSSDLVVVAFRGTDGRADLRADLTFAPIHNGNYSLHRGFWNAYRIVHDDLAELIEAASPEGKKLYITGHSLGGALAVIAGAEFGEKYNAEGIYTYGQPAVGLSEFAGIFDGIYTGRSFRFVNTGDIIPKVPPGFSHTEKEYLLDASGQATRSAGGNTETWTQQEYEAHEREVKETIRENEQHAEHLRGGHETRFISFKPHYIDAYIKRIGKQISESILDLEQLATTRGNNFSRTETESPIEEDAPEQELDLWEVYEQEKTRTNDGLPLAVHVLWSPACNESFNPCRDAARSIFRFLNHLPGNEHDLEEGVGMPVFMGHHYDEVRKKVSAVSSKGDSADSRIIVVVMLHVDAVLDTEYDDFVRWLFSIDWNRKSSSINILPIPVWFDNSWYGEAAYELHASKGAVSARKDLKATVASREVGEEICRYLIEPFKREFGADRKEIKLLISYTNLGLEESDYIGQKIHKHFAESNSIFSLCDLSQERNFKCYNHQEDCNSTVVLIVKTDSHADDSGCQADLLMAKRYGLPIVNLNILNKREQRSLAYGGNSIHLAGDLRKWSSNFHEVIAACEQICLQSLLRHLHFHHAAPSIYKRRDLDYLPRFLSRPPELVDFAQGPLDFANTEMVLYPDPPMQEIESNLLRQACRKTKLATPTTLSIEALRQTPNPPLNGQLIALSLSESVDDLAKNTHLINPEYTGSTETGVFEAHLNASIAYITLSLVRAGAALGYGGHLRGYSSLLGNLVNSYRKTKTTDDQIALYSFIAAFIWDKGPPGKADVTARYQRFPKEGAAATNSWGQALELSLMRHEMAKQCDARVVMGGKSRPKQNKDDKTGYAGRFPGQAEEALRHLRAGKPVYIVGGFYGAAGRIADALQGKTEGLPFEKDFQSEAYQEYRELCDGYAENYATFGDLHETAGFPKTLDQLWMDLADIGSQYFNGGDTGRWVDNGLSREENLSLFTSIDTDEISYLILKGQHELSRRKQDGKVADLEVSLFNGSITDVLDVDAYGSLILRSDTLRGADGAIDEHIGGKIRKCLVSGETDAIIDTNSDQLAGGSVIVEFLDKFEAVESEWDGDEDSLETGIKNGIRSIVQKAVRNGIESLAVVPSGANLGMTVGKSVRTVIDSVLNTDGSSGLKSIVICEIDPERYARVVAAANKKKNDSRNTEVRAISVVELPPGVAAVTKSALSITMRKTNKAADYLEFENIVNSSGGRGAVGADIVCFPMQTLKDLAYREVYKDRMVPPPFSEHDSLGVELAEMIMGESGMREVLNNRSRFWDVLHDIDSSVLPLEMLAFPIEGTKQLFRPALKQGIRRGLLVDDLPEFEHRNAKKPYRLLMIVADPRGNLKSIEKEAEMIIDKLEGTDIEITSLIKEGATLNSVTCALSENHYDFIHFCGHGEQHGLVLQDGKILCGEKIKDITSEYIPSLVVANACKAAEMRDTSAGISLAREILRSGVRSFVSNRWEVGDDSAAVFAVTVYEQMANGKDLGAAILKGRNTLFTARSRDWCNYVLYGSQELRI